MATYTEPEHFVTGTEPEPDTFNAFTDALDYLKAPRMAFAKQRGSATWGGTRSTVFTDWNNGVAEVTTTYNKLHAGTKMMVWVYTTFFFDADDDLGTCYFGVNVSGSGSGSGDTTLYPERRVNELAETVGHVAMGEIGGLAAGTRTYKLRVKVLSAGHFNITINNYAAMRLQEAWD